MSLMTGISGAASLLLLLIPPKLSPGGHFAVTCCYDQNYCHHDNGTVYSITPALNDTLANCDNQEEIMFGLTYADDVTAANESHTEDDCLDMFDCKWSQDAEATPRDDWSQILIFYTVLRCLIDVLRASSIMMFEVS